MISNIITVNVDELPSLNDVIKQYGYYEAGWQQSGNNDLQEMMGFYFGQAIILIQILKVADNFGIYLETEEGRKAYEAGQNARNNPDEED